MNSLPHPVWPVVVLAIIQFGDGLMCLKPAAFIADCFERVNWPRRYWWLMPPIKFAATAGLIAGIWLPYLAAVTSVALVVYFICAVAAHLIARDFSRYLFLNASSMLLACIVVTVFCFVSVQ